MKQFLMCAVVGVAVLALTASDGQAGRGGFGGGHFGGGHFGGGHLGGGRGGLGRPGGSHGAMGRGQAGPGGRQRGAGHARRAGTRIGNQGGSSNGGSGSSGSASGSSTGSPGGAEAEAGFANDVEPGDLPQTLRFLKVKNDTGRRLTVWVRYRTQDAAGQWRWFPSSGGATSYDLDPGEETYLAHQDGKLSASRVRLWAKTAAGERLDEYQSQDLWLVPETDGSGEHVYSAPDVEDFTFTFLPEE